MKLASDVRTVLLSQLLPVLVFVYILSNDKKLLNGYKNGKLINAVIIITFLLIAVTSIAYFVSQFI